MNGVAAGCQWALGIVFLAAVAGKARDFPGFRSSLSSMAPGMAGWAVPVVMAEMFTALSLLIPASARWGFAAAAALSAGLAAVVLRALARGHHEPCPCFGVSARPLGRRHVVRNGLLIVLALAGLASGDPAGPGAEGWPVAVLAGGCAAVLLIFFDDLVELFLPVSRSV
ncbi:MauE/DoxX family redox-associated membrane protein [Nonomuraea sp. NPDC050663]|uniref:MauE/DoxX family redox-associated membrane protein n=1 Tax=Nonomuraea sp. NPDC050663 TaxID=3364370 RepID=UPI0037A37AF6